jgi:hypothetical protein
MVEIILCWLGIHRWCWFSLTEEEFPFSRLHVSQCERCRKLVGGWRGPDDRTPARSIP